MNEGGREHGDGVSLQRGLVVQPQQKVVRLLFALGELEDLRHNDDEEADREDSPEADDDSYDPTEEGFRVELAVADRRAGDDDIPHAVDQIRVILPGHFRDHTLEKPQLECEDDCRENQCVDQKCTRHLLHNALDSEHQVCLCPVHGTDALAARRHELRHVEEEANEQI